MLQAALLPHSIEQSLSPVVQVDGHSHVVHSEEESMGTRLMIDSLTCLLANETDPSKLQAISPGKLMKILVPDGAHVILDQPFAEIEVSSASAACMIAHFHFEYVAAGMACPDSSLPYKVMVDNNCINVMS